MKKAICLLVSLVLSLAFIACSGTLQRQEQPKKSIRIGVSVYDQYDTFVGVMMDWFTSCVKEKEQSANITISVVQESAERNQVTQNNQVEGFVEAGCDIICVNSVDRTNASVIIDKAKAAGVPVIFFNRELVEEDLESWDQLYYVGAPALQSGMLQGRIISDLCQKDLSVVDRSGDGILQYVMLEGEAGHQDAIVRTEYAVSSVIASGFKMERLEDEIANWVREQAETKMTQWLEVHGTDIEVVFANNDDMALGAADALEKAQVPPENRPMVVGIDGTPPGLQGVADGKLIGTVLNDAEGQAKGMFEMAWSLAIEKTVPANMELENGKYMRLPYQIVTADNLEEYIGRAAK